MCVPVVLVLLAKQAFPQCSGPYFVVDILYDMLLSFVLLHVQYSSRHLDNNLLS